MCLEFGLWESLTRFYEAKAEDSLVSSMFVRMDQSVLKTVDLICCYVLLVATIDFTR